MESFARTAFDGAGGLLVLVGGDPAEVATLRALASAGRIERVVLDGVVSQARLEELYGTARLLVMPLLEEGFGLLVPEKAKTRRPALR